MKIIEVDGDFDNIIDILQKHGIKNKIIKQDHCSDKTLITHESIISTKIAQVEKQLQKLEKTFTDLTKRVRGFLNMELSTGKYTLVDKFLENLSGYPINEWMEKPYFIQSIIHNDFKDSYKKFIEQLNEGIVPRILEYKIIRSDGEERWWLQFNLGSYDVEGNLVSISQIVLDNTEKKETEIKYRNLFENINAGVFRTNIETGEFLDVNERIIQFTGYETIEEFKKNTKAQDFYANLTDREKIVSILKKKGIITDYEVPLKHKNGSIVWVSHSAKLYPKEGFCEGIIIDITERKKTEKELIENEEKFRSIVDQSVAGILIINNGTIEFANQIISNYSGYNLDFLKSLQPYAFINLVHPEDHETVQSMLELSKDEGITPEFYVRIITRCNKIKWLSMQFKKLMQENSSHIVAVLVEVTKRVNLEQKYRKERDIAQKYFDIAGSLLLVLDSDETVKQINKRGSEILGYSQEEILGKNWIENFLPERARSGVKQTFRKVLAGEICPDDCFENYILTKNGEERLILWHNNTITDDNGNVEYIISAGEDITELELKMN